MTDYAAIGSLEFRSLDQWGCHECPSRMPLPLPMDMGPFTLKMSPNADAYFADVFGYDLEPTADWPFDVDFPFSALYAEMESNVPDEGHLEDRADRQFECLEWLLRLFQPGDISVRRYGPVRNVKNGREWVSWGGPPAKPNARPLYATQPYHVHAQTLMELMDFVARYWAVISEACKPFTVALTRFSSSYERRELVDRLIDLVIALEALFSGSDPGNVTFKIAVRSACWLKPPGQERLTMFQAIKKSYNLRSNAVHARGREQPTAEDIDELESTVRACLIRFLDYHILHGKTPLGDKIDELFLTGAV